MNYTVIIHFQLVVLVVVDVVDFSYFSLPITTILLLYTSIQLFRKSTTLTTVSIKALL